MTLAAEIDAIRRYWAGRRVVLAVDHVHGGPKALADELNRCGADIRAVVVNAAPTPGLPSAPHVWSCAEQGVRLRSHEFETWLCDPPAALLDWLDALDPERAWTVVGTTYTRAASVGGRPVRGRWRDEWAVWEDKTRVEDLWRATGVASPPHEVCAADDPALPAIAARLDHGDGVVVAADNSKGPLGSSQGLRWVHGRAELDAALPELREITTRVRVAAYLPGTPCSILAMVLPDGVAVFDPFEIITLREPDTGRLVYCGTSTWWRPSDPEPIRDCAARVGAELARTAGYAGMFSVDGLLGPDGFLATELNPRHVSGLGLRAGRPRFPIRLLNRALQDGRPQVRVDRAELEDAVRRTVRDVPSCSVWVPVPGLADGPEAGLGRIRYRPQCGGAWLTGVDPMPAGGALGSVAAELCNALGDGPIRLHADSG